MMCSAGTIRLKALNPPQMRTYLWSAIDIKDAWSVTTYCDWIVDGACSVCHQNDLSIPLLGLWSKI
jgi:hypothetical protein